MINLPASFVDFSSALKMLADSQGDITEIITKWDDITDTTTARTVTVTLSDGTTHEVDNLAKIRKDLIAGLSLDEPLVTAIHFNGYRTSSTLQCNLQYGREWHGEDDEPFYYTEGYLGIYQNIYNDLRTAYFPRTSNITVALQNIPRVIMLGASFNEDDVISNVYITITPPPEVYVQDGVMVPNKHYCALVTFVNRNFGSSPNVNPTGNPVYLELSSGGITQYQITIQPKKCCTFLIFALAGGTMATIHEIQPNT